MRRTVQTSALEPPSSVGCVVTSVLLTIRRPASEARSATKATEGPVVKPLLTHLISFISWVKVHQDQPTLPQRGGVQSFIHSKRRNWVRGNSPDSAIRALLAM